MRDLKERILIIRRLQQIAVALFLPEAELHGITPVQYAALQTVANAPGIDQRTLARTIGLDTSTIASVIDRLEARGLMQRSSSPDDRRVRMLSLTGDGQAALSAVVPAMQRAQERILEPLPKKERIEFMRMLRTLVDANNELRVSQLGVGVYLAPDGDHRLFVRPNVFQRRQGHASVHGVLT